MLVKLCILAVVLGCFGDFIPVTGADAVSEYALVDPKTGKQLPQAGYSTEAFGVNAANFQAPNCDCAKYYCNCCVGMKVHDHVENVCGKVAFDVNRLAASGSLVANNRQLWHQEFSPSNPPSICYGIKGAIKACMRLYNLNIHGKNFHGCMQLSMKVNRFTVLRAHVGCMDIGVDGVHYSRA